MILKDIKPILLEQSVNPIYIERFARIAEKYGFNPAKDNILPFCTLILDHPNTFRNFNLLTSKWKAPKTLSEMFRSIKHVCSAPILKKEIGDQNVAHIHQALDDYLVIVLQQLHDEPNNQNQPPSNQNLNHNNNVTPQEIDMIFNATPHQNNQNTATRSDLFTIQDHSNSDDNSQSHSHSDSENDHNENENENHKNVNHSHKIKKNKKNKNDKKIIHKLIQIQTLTNSIFLMLNENETDEE